MSYQRHVVTYSKRLKNHNSTKAEKLCARGHRDQRAPDKGGGEGDEGIHVCSAALFEARGGGGHSAEGAGAAQRKRH